MQNKIKLIFILLIAPLVAVAQTTITGTVKDQKGETLPGANIYLNDTFDGANSDINGNFSFDTEETGQHLLVISFIGFKTLEKAIALNTPNLSIELVLTEVINKVDGVTISAGAFESSDVKKITVLKPLDIVTTASAAGDIMGAINTLPGTATVGESGKLFVRGGEGYETKVFIDGMEARNAFGASAPNVPTRGRFSPFLFKGTIFSTGGYSAEYGQALSSVLILNSNDIAEKSKADISLMSVGGDIGYTKKWENTSLSGKVQYTNLRPYQELVKQTFDWEKAPVNAVSEIVFRQKVKKTGLLKIYANADISDFIIRQPNINNDGIKDTIGIKNNYYYLNTTYTDILSSKWSLKAGLSTTSNTEDIDFNQEKFNGKEVGTHAKVALNWDANEKVSLNFGSEFLYKKFTREVTPFEAPTSEYDFTDNIAATYVEGDYYASNKFILRTGLRYEHSSLLNKSWLNPRIAASYKLTDNGQFSMAYGKFLQAPQNDYAVVNNNLTPEVATHFMLNYQHIVNNRVFRVEAYQKVYDDLVKYTSPNDFTPDNFNNKGYGKARGIDFFWRDGVTFKATDYWVSYSYVDSNRDYMDYTEAATPSFVSKHNFSFVIKHLIQPIRVQVGATYNFASTRLFHNPNKPGFQNDGTPSFHDLSLNTVVLIKQNIILYMSCSNVFGRDNVFGYEYADSPNESGFYKSQPIIQGAKRFVFVGLFITLTKDGQENQLRNL
jgi:TonB-dependent receptor-like protein/carboxypeptidase-like protein